MEHFCDAVQIGFILLKRLIKLQFYEIYEIIKWIYFWIFPLPVKSISGKLALVGEICPNSFRVFTII